LDVLQGKAKGNVTVKEHIYYGTPAFAKASAGTASFLNELTFIEI